jgi:molybdate transport system substrate-binding protein
VLSTLALAGAWRELEPPFEVDLVLAPGGAINKRIAAGESGDVVVSSTSGVEGLVKSGKIVAGSTRALAASGVGVAVKKGARKPDISSAEALKRTVLAAKAVAYSDPAGGGASGIHFAAILERLGIAEQVNARAKRSRGVLNAELVVNGEADLAIQQIPELLAVAGIDLVGPLPAELQQMTEFSVGLLSSSKRPEESKALIDFLASSDTSAVLKAQGFELDR